MCGIAGIFDARGVSAQSAEAVSRMTAAQTHRGPDADGLYVGERAVLGHRRLSILDLSDAGRQPMSNEDGSIWTVYNGEIYNYRELRQELIAAGHAFRSSSDTEVLIHGYEQWGIERLLGKLRGMFAFAIYDVRNNVTNALILARDRVGIKPLYYYRSTDILIFASEVKALLHSGLVPANSDPEALIGFLLAGSVPAPLTTVQGVRCLEPGHYLVAGHSGCVVRKYWDLDTAAPDAGKSAPSGELGLELREALQDSIARHLVSDVPVGVFLSGGVDSAAVATLAGRARLSGSPPITTLTVSFDEHEFSEASQAAGIAAHLGADHRAVRVTSADFEREMPAFFRAMDQPTNDGVNTYFVSRAARQAGLTVVLSGLGGDEVFWGYSHYRWLESRASWLARCPAAIRRPLVGAFSTAGRLRGRESWRRTSYISREVSNGGLYLMFRGFFAPRQVATLLDISLAEVEATAQKYFSAIAPAQTGNAVGPVGFNYIETKRYLHDQLLRDTDVFSMAHSIEARVPLLDHKVIECAARFASSARLDRAVNKPLLVDAVGDPFVKAAALRKKRGFSFPMDRWMKESIGNLEEISRGSKLLDRRTVAGAWKSFRNGRLHWSRAWALAVIGAAGR